MNRHALFSPLFSSLFCLLLASCEDAETNKCATDATSQGGAPLAQTGGQTSTNIPTGGTTTIATGGTSSATSAISTGGVTSTGASASGGLLASGGTTTATSTKATGGVTMATGGTPSIGGTSSTSTTQASPYVPCSCAPYTVPPNETVDAGTSDTYIYEAWSRLDRADLIKGQVTRIGYTDATPPLYQVVQVSVPVTSDWTILVTPINGANRSIRLGSILCGEVQDSPNSEPTHLLTHLFDGSSFEGVLSGSEDTFVDNGSIKLNILHPYMSGSSSPLARICFRYISGPE